MTVFFDIDGSDGGKWIVNFSTKPYIKEFEENDKYDNKYSLNIKCLKNIYFIKK